MASAENVVIERATDEPGEVDLALWWLNQWPPWGWEVEIYRPPQERVVPPGHPDYSRPYHRYKLDPVATYTVTITRTGHASITRQASDGRDAWTACIREAYRQQRNHETEDDHGTPALPPNLDD